MGQINLANLRKTAYFLKRNGIKNTCYEIKERLEERKKPPYVWREPSPETLAAQSRQAEREDFRTRFSIVVPAYQTPERCLRELLDSLLKQSYPRWELVLADATEEDALRRVAGQYEDSRIRYVHLGSNGGIAENTNSALELVTGDYTGLLDHDDVLAPQALYEMAVRIEAGRRAGTEPRILYSDEDKCNGDLTVYYEPNRKEDFNLDMLLCNNYICHFMVMESGLIRRLGFRSEFDGAQDHDLVLRALDEIEDPEKGIVHIPEVLYHWRCHSGSTAENPWSKEYAYRAGCRAVQSFADRRGWAAKAEEMPNPGFYRLRYAENPLRFRKDLGALGGRLTAKGRIVGGRMGADGAVVYEGLPAGYSGYLHRAALQQDAEALDIRNFALSEELWGLFEESLGFPYAVRRETGKFDIDVLPEGADPLEVSLRLSRVLRDKGYRLLYIPEY